MTSLRLLAVLLALIGLTTAITCYYGFADSKGNIKNTTNCAAKFCVTVQGKADIPVPTVHACDLQNFCKKDECVTDEEDGDTICCCSYDLCNSSSILVALPAVATIVLSKLLF
ncbi:hypothetical protein RB195_002431 [Necator americanus]|uniref:ET module n=1 Tax=Necator americanus TaxID=51031 RepID=A0ABR1DJ17_NECAM